jgi:ABC-2 type transport system permease protein
MSRIWTIVKREYLENVRTKAFIIGIVLTPVWIGIMFLVPALQSGPDRQEVVIVDETGVLATEIQSRLEALSPSGRSPGGRRAQGTTYDVRIEPAATAFDMGPENFSRIDGFKRQAGAGEILLVVLTPSVLEKRAPREGENAPGIYAAGSASTAGIGQAVLAIVNAVATEHVLTQREIPRETAELIATPAIARVVGLDEEGEAAGIASAILPFIMIMLLYMGIMGISQMLISSTLEEKGNRVYEVLLSSVSPFQLMAGKILGICAVGLTLLSIWSGGGLLAASAQGTSDLVSGAQIGWFLVYYLLGFLMIASLMVAIGSACNTIKEAQNLMAPISMLLVLPLIFSMVTMQNPNGTLATAASFIPPFTPFMMMARMAGAPGPPDWQIWVTLVLLVIATYAAIRLAARVFRVGILLYGQAPSLKQIFRWMRAAD